MKARESAGYVASAKRSRKRVDVEYYAVLSESQSHQSDKDNTATTIELEFAR